MKLIFFENPHKKIRNKPSRVKHIFLGGRKVDMHYDGRAGQALLI